MHSILFSFKRMVPILLIVLLSVRSVCLAGSSSEITIIDSSGQTIRLKETPKRVVSLVPGATETFFALGAGDRIVGLTYHDTFPREANSKTIVGGFFDPVPELIEKLRPDIILLSQFQSKIRERFVGSGITLIEVDAHTIEDGFKTIELVGKVSGKTEEATAKIGKIRKQLDLVSRKVSRIPENKRKRVMRLMGSDGIMTPGDGSFQNEFIQLAGGIPPSFGKSGAVVRVTEEEWKKFNPQFIYYCGIEGRLFQKLFDKPGWKDVEAVKNSNYAHFPCDLTCRASVHMGDFVAWLAGVIYADELTNEDFDLSPDAVSQSRGITVDLPYVKAAQVIDASIHDFPTQTLLIDFTEPMSCVNSCAGSATRITTVGNHYFSAPLWTIGHSTSIDSLKNKVCTLSTRRPESTSLLYTGAKMDNLSIQRTDYKDMVVYALVTAGVETNAICSSVDEGKFYEPGTINIIILTNMRLTARAQARAIISATEAKSAALQDLDIRSSYSPRYQATGTGTDEVLVVEGRGKTVENTGGHSKLGELIAKGVYQGVKESISLQNGLSARRSVFQRLNERKIDLYGLVSECGRFSREDVSGIYAGLEKLLLNPSHAGFLESSFALGTACDSGLVCDIKAFQDICRHKCEEVAGCPVDTLIEFVPRDMASKPIRMAIDAFLNGLNKRKSASSKTSSVGGQGK
ncbi:adenosylcobinamide amidohydrolase [Desulfomonile tiedjei]|uniref:ABC-type Fe3+-hydroxamate transport system, periplasmic component n=1 Tax=Desulfomonile tiedjei (strain ATCC 49306 / DSM 6799 / DCB-1) TaxID=706587 RepID=I4C8X4_DESTA|nr:adenosylcobinamide amidohydrolase [Desulfomonile tiedjei]AFM26015.1 ABC-type Fe3+-hydroxamate transport system, periplasmic component [Desulfomonile tiedjei DSM 6799]